MGGRLPHGCGDGSAHDNLFRLLVEFTPRVWGWFVLHEHHLLLQAVYPTGVGMVRLLKSLAPAA